MIRYLYIGFVIGCTGLLAQASDNPTPSAATRPTATTLVPAPAASATTDKTKKTDAKATASTTTTADKTKKVDAKAATTVATAKVDTKATKPGDNPTPSTSSRPTATTLIPSASPTTDKAKKTDVKATASTTAIDKSKITASTTSNNAPSSTSSHLTSTRGTGSRSLASATPSRPVGDPHLARLTAYWSGEGDYYTGRGMSSTGVHLHNGHCAVDPRIIPYGSVVEIAGLGKYLAVDTGSAVISREAARETGHTPEQRNALVIDLFFESRRDGERFAASSTKFAVITWSSPRSTASTQDVTSTVAE